jgi:hypothetical protein
MSATYNSSTYIFALLWRWQQGRLCHYRMHTFRGKEGHTTNSPGNVKNLINLLGIHCSKKDRLKEVEWFAVHLEPEMPTVVAGDFNETEQAASASYFTQTLKFKSVLSKDKTPTWHWTIAAGMPTLHDTHFSTRVLVL